MPYSRSSRRSELTVTLRELAWTIHRRVPERAGVGPLPTTEIALLKQVIDTPLATVSELSALLGLRQPNASAALRVLTERGLVVRESSPEDRRVSRVVATPRGEAEHRAIADAWSTGLREALEELGPDDLAAVEAAGPGLQSLLRVLRAGSEASSTRGD